MQQIIDKMLEAKEEATPPQARLAQHDNALKEMAWNKEQVEAQIQKATETRKYWNEQVEEGENKFD